jgi:hypothetical protein
MKKLSFVLISALFFGVISCQKKEEKQSEPVYTSNLPNYGNVDLDHVFTDEDKILSDKNTITQYIDQYYQKVWEKGNLSGGILVAKGDEILYENYRGFGREGNQMPIDKNTPLHVASVSKT